MQGRTFFRIMIDNLFVNNPFCKAVTVFVNLCNNAIFYNKKSLKFYGKMPLYKKEQELNYKKRFVFDSSRAYGVNTK